MLMRVPRPILLPKSRKHLPEHIKLGRESSPMVIDLTRDSEQQFETSKQGKNLCLSYSSLLLILSLGIKRSAPDSFVTKSSFGTSSNGKQPWFDCRDMKLITSRL